MRKHIIAWLGALLVSTSVSQAATVVVERAVTFRTDFTRMVDVLKKNEKKLNESATTKVLWRKGDRARIEMTTPQGLVTYFTLEIKENIDRTKKVAVFQSKLVETDGFVTAQDTVVKVREVDGKTVANIKVTVTCPEVPQAVLRLAVNGGVQNCIRQIRQLSKER